MIAPIVLTAEATISSPFCALRSATLAVFCACVALGRRLAHALADLTDGGRGLFQGGGLLLGALGEVASGDRDLGHPLGDAVGGVLDLDDRVAQRRARPVVVEPQLVEFGREGRGEMLVEPAFASAPSAPPIWLTARMRGVTSVANFTILATWPLPSRIGL